jgi:excisionase family DNA binding protein
MKNQLQLHVEPRFARLEEPLLTPADAARLLVVKTSWVYEAVRDGRLPCVRIGRHIRFLRSDLERFVDGRRAASSQ